MHCYSVNLAMWVHFIATLKLLVLFVITDTVTALSLFVISLIFKSSVIIAFVTMLAV